VVLCGIVQDHVCNCSLHALYAAYAGVLGSVQHSADGAMQDPACELPRISIPRTSVNKGKKTTGHGRMLTKALKEVPSVEPAGAGKTAVVRRGRITTVSHRQ
jgi:hypothetical protein